MKMHWHPRLNSQYVLLVKKLLGVILFSLSDSPSVSCLCFPCLFISRLGRAISMFTPIMHSTHLHLMSWWSSTPASCFIVVNSLFNPYGTAWLLNNLDYTFVFFYFCFEIRTDDAYPYRPACSSYEYVLSASISSWFHSKTTSVKFSVPTTNSCMCVCLEGISLYLQLLTETQSQ